MVGRQYIVNLGLSWIGDAECSTGYVFEGAIDDLVWNPEMVMNAEMLIGMGERNLVNWSKEKSSSAQLRLFKTSR